MSRAIFLYNPVAGRRPLTDRCLDQIISLVKEETGLEIHPRQAEPWTSGKTLDSSVEADLVVVWGGDGTIQQAVLEAIDRRVPLAILPAGTANVLAGELGLPSSLQGALKILREGHRARLHLGKANGRIFTLMAGIGVDAHINRLVHPGLKRLLGVGAYWVAGLTHFWNYPLKVFRVCLDKQESLEATFAVVSNSKSYGGDLVIAPQGDVFKPELDVILFTSQSHLRFLKYLSWTRRGKHVELEDVLVRKAQHIEVTGDPDLAVQLDGEMAGCLPRVFDVAEEVVEVFVPKSRLPRTGS